MVQINASSTLEKNGCFKGVINRLVSFINVLGKKKKSSCNVLLLLQSLRQMFLNQVGFLIVLYGNKITV